MKSLHKKHLIGISIFACLVLGGFLSKPILSVFYTPAATVIDAPDAIYIARDISTYAQHASLIVIGQVHEVTDPYLANSTSVNLQQDAQVDIAEVLKGDSGMKNVRVSRLADQIEGVSSNSVSALKGKTGLLKPGEKVLLFLAKEPSGDYVVFAGPYGKYLISAGNTVTSEGDFKMSFGELKSQIQTALKNPAPPYKPPVFSQER